MKKNIIILLLLFFVQNVTAQETRMWVGKKDGKVFSYPIDSIDKITIAKHSSVWDYNAMNVFTKQGPFIPRGYDEFHTIDSIAFKGDSLKIFNAGFWQRYSITGATNSNHWTIDSITFSFYQKDNNVIIIDASDTYRHWACTYNEYIAGLYKYANWIGNRIYFSNPLGFFEIDSQFHAMKDSDFCPTFATNYNFSIDASEQNFLGAGLQEYNLTTGKATIYLKRVDSNVSSAQYFSSDSILYYSYGPSYSQSNHTPADAGYYFYDKKTNRSSFILNYISEIGKSEDVNGFDLSPDRKKLLIPVVRKKDSPFLIEYDLQTGHKDTLHSAVFNGIFGTWSLWVRYSHDGSQILYNGGQTGIIDRSSLSGKFINTNPDNESIWVTKFPQWSPDDKEIIYCAASVSIEPAGRSVHLEFTF